MDEFEQVREYMDLAHDEGVVDYRAGRHRTNYHTPMLAWAWELGWRMQAFMDRQARL